MTSDEIKHVMRMSAGATKTRNCRETELYSIRNLMHGPLNLQVKSFAHLKVYHIKALVEKWRGQGLSLGCMQNKMSHLRTALQVYKRFDLVKSDALSNKGLKLSGRKRGGTHVPLTFDKFKNAYEHLVTEKPGIAFVLHIQWATCGLLA